MNKQAVVTLYVLTMVAVVVVVDVLFFRHRFGARLAANICIVVLFGVCWIRFLKRP